VDKVEVEAEAPPLPEPPADTGEICFDIIDKNTNGLWKRNVNRLTHSRSNILFFSLISIYLYDAEHG
jgi:hypothetical protein